MSEERQVNHNKHKKFVKRRVLARRDDKILITTGRTKSLRYIISITTTLLAYLHSAKQATYESPEDLTVTVSVAIARERRRRVCCLNSFSSFAFLPLGRGWRGRLEGVTQGISRFSVLVAQNGYSSYSCNKITSSKSSHSNVRISLDQVWCSYWTKSQVSPLVTPSEFILYIPRIQGNGMIQRSKY